MQIVLRRHSLRSCAPWSMPPTREHYWRYWILLRAAYCPSHHRHSIISLAALPSTLALPSGLQLATQGHLNVYANCPAAQPSAVSLGKACNLRGGHCRPSGMQRSCSSCNTCNSATLKRRSVC